MEITITTDDRPPVSVDVPAGLAVLLTQRRGWMGIMPGDPWQRLFHLIPSVRDPAGWYTYLGEVATSRLQWTTEPTTAAGVARELRLWCPDLDLIQWQPDDTYQPGDPNPVMDPDTP